MVLKKGMIIRFVDQDYVRNWIILPVTKKELNRGINAEGFGLYAFGGLWYGRNPMKTKSYGKIVPIDETDNIEVIHNDIIGLSVNEIAKLVN